MLNELVFALRRLSRRPGFMLIGIVALGVGLAATILVFGVVNTMLLRPLPGIAEGARLVEIGRLDSSGRFDTVSFPYYRDVAEQSDTLDEVFAYRFGPVYLQGSEAPRAALAMLASGNYFGALGVRPLHGQLFVPAHDAAPGREPVAVLSEAGFRRHFEGDPAIVGQSIRINGGQYTVIGVAAGFGGHMTAIAPEIFVPLSMAGAMQMRDDAAREQRYSNWLRLGGRLAPGATLADARAELAAVSAALAPLAEDPARAPVFDAVKLRPLPQAAQGIVGFLAAGLMVMCAAILALACSNLAGILLAQGEARAAEFAMRGALGASRGRLMRQLLVESSLVAFAAGAVGLLLAQFGRNALALIPLPVPFPIDLGIVIDARVVAFALGASGLVALAFGLTPALKVSAAAPGASLRSGASGSTGHAPSRRQWLLAAQSGLTVALLLIAVLTLLALQRAATVETGFRTGNVYTSSVDTTPLGLGSETAVARVTQLVERLRLQPGVEQASFASIVPLTMSRLGYGAARLPGSDLEAVSTDANTVGEGFFRVFDLPVRGRPIDGRDRADSTPVAVINQRLAKRLFGDAEPIGGEFEMGGGTNWRRIQVVGVVPDGRYASLTDDDRAFAFLPATQRERTQFELFVHGRIDPLALQRVLAEEMRQVLPDVPPPTVHRFADVAALSILPQRILGSVAGVLALLALALAATGLYGVLAYQVERRFHEFGVRRTLGASDRQVATALLRRIVYWLGGGVLAGLLLAQGMAFALGDLLFGIGGANPIALTIALAAFVLMISLAVVVPMRKALRLQPMAALRYE